MAKEEIAGFYTRSRKFPKMIGRLTDGTRIWGGPYTFTQAGVGGVVLLILLTTRNHLWSTGFVLFDLALAAGVSWCVIKVVGYIPTFRRNLVSVFVDAVSAMFKPRGGTYQGKAVKLAQPHQAVGKTTLLAPSARPEPATEHIEVAAPTPAPVVAEKPQAPAPTLVHAHDAAERPSHRPISAVERLLQQTKSNTP
ncbi:hypothetical protein [Microbacterium maritypicum]|uniref:hypothetical protein n=1 Tax=Microbacterium maritypicum TaxID=33918 RepID=UPI003A94BEF3